MDIDALGYPDHFLFSAALYVEAETIITNVIMAAETVELFFGLPPKAGIACCKIQHHRDHDC